jgi:hypothetical protein
MSDWGGETVGEGLRWAPADHYDQGLEVLTNMPASGGDPQLLMLGWFEVIGHALLGLLRAEMERGGGG